MIEFIKNTKYKVQTPEGFKSFSGMRRTTKSEVVKFVFEHNKVLKCSLDHRFIVSGKEIFAKDLKEGDLLSNGIAIKSIEIENYSSFLYDLTDVEGNSIYTADEIDSHNCDFTTSGATVILPEILKYYEENTLAEPIERQGLDRALWVWEYPDPMKFYAVVADVARGDGADYSAFHIIDTETLTQVAEYQAQVDTREYANILLSEAARYNNALLVIENANIGWDVIQSVIERGYTNMYYSHKVDNNADFEAYMAQYNRGDGLVPGFSTTQKSRPLIIERMRDFLENKLVTIRSIRLLEELRSFIWKNGKSQAMQGRNDDLVMAFAIAMYLRESSLRFKKTAENLTYASLNSMTRTGEGRPIYNTERNTKSNPWNMEITAGGNQQNFDISWLIG